MTTLRQRIITQRWFLIRVLLCAGAALSGFFAPLSEGLSNPDDVLIGIMSASVAILILFPFMLVVQATWLAVSPSNRHMRWEKPDWLGRPFFRKGPHHFFHLCASTSIAGGLGASIAYLTKQHSDLVSIVMPIVMGGSIFVGINMTQGIFEGRYEPLPEDDHEVQLPLRNELMIAVAWLGVFLLVAAFVGTMAYVIYPSWTLQTR